MSELLGFVVLAGPVFPMLIWLIVSLLLAWLLSKLFKRRAARVFSGIGLLILIFLLPLADGIVGRVYFNYLCATEAGVKVYKTVELPAEYWDEGGRAKLFKENGDLDHTKLGNMFNEPSFTEPYSPILGIEERHHQVVDNNANETLGEVINFMHWGGWASRNLSPNRSAIDCKAVHGNKFWNNFYSKLFRPENSSK